MAQQRVGHFGAVRARDGAILARRDCHTVRLRRGVVSRRRCCVAQLRGGDTSESAGCGLTDESVSGRRDELDAAALANEHLEHCIVAETDPWRRQRRSRGAVDRGVRHAVSPATLKRLTLISRRRDEVECLDDKGPQRWPPGPRVGSGSRRRCGLGHDRRPHTIADESRFVDRRLLVHAPQQRVLRADGQRHDVRRGQRFHEQRLWQRTTTQCSHVWQAGRDPCVLRGDALW